MGDQLRRIAKRPLRLLGLILVSPAWLSYVVGSTILGRDRALQGTIQGLSLIPGVTGQYLRNAFLRQVLDHCHPSVVVEFGSLLSKVGARLEENVYIGPMCHIGLATIGRDTLLAAGVHVPSGPRIHGIDRVDVPIREQEGRPTRVSIGPGCWIGSGAIVLADVGQGSVIAAGSVVSRPIPAQVVAAGVPAQVVRSRLEPPGAG